MAVVDARELPDARCSALSPCNPIAQTGCCSNEKCTWARVQPHMECASIGAVELGAPCTIDAAGFDDCMKGAVCSAGACKTICDPQATPEASGCVPDQQCVIDEELFRLVDVHVAGVCETP